MQEGVLAAIASWLVAVLAAERLAEIIVDSKLLGGFRSAVARWSYADGAGQWRSKFSDLVTCGFCTSGWTSLLFATTLPGAWFEWSTLGNLFAKWFAVYGLANFWHTIFRLMYRGRVQTVDVSHTLTLNESSVEDSDEELIDLERSNTDDIDS